MALEFWNDMLWHWNVVSGIGSKANDSLAEIFDQTTFVEYESCHDAGQQDDDEDYDEEEEEGMKAGKLWHIVLFFHSFSQISLLHNTFHLNVLCDFSL